VTISNGLVGVGQANGGRWQKWVLEATEREFFTLASTWSGAVLTAFPDGSIRFKDFPDRRTPTPCNHPKICIYRWKHDSKDDNYIWFYHGHTLRNRAFPDKVMDCSFNQADREGWGEVYLYHGYHGLDWQLWKTHGSKISTFYKNKILTPRNEGYDGDEVGCSHISRKDYQHWHVGDTNRTKFSLYNTRAKKVASCEGTSLVTLASPGGGKHKEWFWMGDHLACQREASR